MEMLARWSIAHRRLVIVGWAVLLVCSIALTATLKSHFVNNLTLPNTDAQRASTLLQEQFPAVSGDSDQIVFHTTRKTLAAPAIRNKVTATLNAVSRLPHVTRVSSPYSTAGAISRDQTIGFATVHFDERGDALPADAVKRVITVAESAGSQRLQVALGGNAIEQSQKPTLGVATAVGILAAMVVLYLCFGSFLAMALPILAALFGVGTAGGLIAALTHVLNTPSFASQLALLIGLGVGVDYALFLVTRYRDAYRENGGDVNAAIELAMNTAGRSIAFAGTTVVIAVLGLFVVGVQFLYGVALATSLTVLLVLAASLTLLPASLSLAGRRIGRRRAGRRIGWAHRSLGPVGLADPAATRTCRPCLDRTAIGARRAGARSEVGGQRREQRLRLDDNPPRIRAPEPRASAQASTGRSRSPYACPLPAPRLRSTDSGPPPATHRA